MFCIFLCYFAALRENFFSQFLHNTIFRLRVFTFTHQKRQVKSIIARTWAKIKNKHQILFKMKYNRMAIEVESPEEMGYDTIKYNLAESSVRDVALGELGLNLNDLILCYGEHRGDINLRKAIVSDSQVLKPEQVLVTTGAVTALFLVATTLLNTDDHLIVIRPNYATNLETPRAIGCQSTVIDLKFDDNFEIDIEVIKAAIKPNTRLISFTNPHNPTGKVFSESVINELINLATENNCYLLADETYRDLNFQTVLEPYLAERHQNVISVCSLSKAFGTPGIRIGWAICQDQSLMIRLLAAKEQVVICNSVVDEAIALHLLKNQEQFLPKTHQYIRQNFEIIRSWFETQPYLEWNNPTAGVVCFVRVKDSYKIDMPQFYEALYKDFQTIVGPGHWFEQPQNYMRIGFGYPTPEELKQGLLNLEECLRKFVK